MDELNAEVADARHWVEESSRIVVLTGVGISTDSGIPDFRGPQGVWTKNPTAEKLSNIHYYMTDPDVRRLAWQSRLEHPTWRAVPNGGHEALVRLERRGSLLALVTQNIDGLHQRAGNSPTLVIEVHGTVHEVICMRCGMRGPMQETLDRVRAGEDDPSCLACGGILKSTTIGSFIVSGFNVGEPARRICRRLVSDRRDRRCSASRSRSTAPPGTVSAWPRSS